jgi:hypothetical protein
VRSRSRLAHLRERFFLRLTNEKKTIMKFEKGNKGGGRKKGSTNKTTDEIKQSFNLLLGNNLEQLQNDLDKMKPEARFNAMMSLAKFVVPQLKSEELKITESYFQPIEIILTNENK